MRIHAAHVALQFTDPNPQHTQDIEKLLDRAVARRYDWIMGTEAGPGAGNTSDELIRVAREHDYRPWVPSSQALDPRNSTDCWILVREGIIHENWQRGVIKAVPSSDELRDRGVDIPADKSWGPKGLVHASFDNGRLGRINLGVAHYITEARTPASPYWKYNQRIADRIGAWGIRVGQGTGLAFYSGDQNMADSKNDEPQGDTFMGNPFTSVEDELKKWENTGNGPIDVIATYNKDARVSALNVQVLDDSEFFLNTDHFLVEAVIDVEPLP